MAVAIVKDGNIVVAKGYAVRKLGEDEFTMFGIGSNTKAFTTAALATLIDDGKLSWDDPVYQRLPGRRAPVRIQSFPDLLFFRGLLQLLSGPHIHLSGAMNPGTPVFTTSLSLCLV